MGGCTGASRTVEGGLVDGSSVDDDVVVEEDEEEEVVAEDADDEEVVDEVTSCHTKTSERAVAHDGWIVLLMKLRFGRSA